MEIQANGALAICGLGLKPGVVFMAAPTIEALRARQGELQASSAELIDAADQDERDLSDDEIGQIEANRSEAEKIGRQIAAREAVAPPQAGLGRRTVSDAAAAVPAAGGNRQVPAQARRDDPRNGFRSFGEFAMAVRSARGGQPDNRLLNAASTFGSEGTGADGGFAVPPEFARELYVKVQAEENLMNRCAPLTIGGNNITIPKDETTPWQTSGGVIAYWEAEAAAVAASKPSLESSTIRLAKLMALVPLTDELLEDAIGLESWLRAKAPAKMAAKINTAIVSGTGAGQPLGILNSDSMVSVAKESSQPADTIYFANVNKMFSRMYAPWRRNGVWLINQDVEPQLNAMAFDPAATSKVPVYLPNGSVAGSPYATLLGRPVVPVEACSTIGDQGDILFVDFNQYWVISRAGGVQTDTSMHLYFDQGLTAFRFTFRMNGMPAWSSAINPQNGTLTRSWAVALDARA
jgi:HK97 family phage major capsid protein